MPVTGSSSPEWWPLLGSVHELTTHVPAWVEPVQLTWDEVSSALIAPAPTSASTLMRP